MKIACAGSYTRDAEKFAEGKPIELIGGEELLRVACTGDYFGEIGTLFGLPRSATVRARTDATVIGYTGKAFRERLGPAGVRDAIEGRNVSID